MNIRNLTAKDILSVYSGQDGKCCCGCAGKHYYNPSYMKEGTKYRGYEVTEDETSIKMVEKVLKVLKQAEELEIDGSGFISTVVGKRLYIVYLLGHN